MTRTFHPKPELQIRLVSGYDVVLGPGKADLLDAIASTGSITAAASQLGISYKKAWQLMGTMNSLFPQPLVATETGGNQRGGATLTPFGQQVLTLFRQLEQLIDPALAEEAQALLDLLPPPEYLP
ncbi:MAG: winged helix-turn-helix domain-containing protein [Marinobacter sp.]|nr:winged helix-turn-helix domain-containing protein [Marinobacter sp.]